MNRIGYAFGGAKIQMTPERVRRLGWAMLALGIILTLMMGSLAAGFAWILLFPHGAHGTTFDGGPGTAAGIMALFLFLLTFGISASLTGIRQIRTGQRDLRIAKFAMVVLAVIFILGTLAKAANR